MIRLLGFAMIAGALTFVLQHDATAQTKTPPKGTTVTAAVGHYAMLRSHREIVGVVESINGNSVVMKVAYDHANVTKTAARPTGNRRPAKPQVKATPIHDVVKFDLPFIENANFRTLGVSGGLGNVGSVQYDEKGEPKAPAKTPAATAAPTEKLLGSPANLADFGPGDTVKAVLAAPLVASGNNHPRVKTLVLLKDVADPATTTKKKK